MSSSTTFETSTTKFWALPGLGGSPSRASLTHTHELMEIAASKEPVIKPVQNVWPFRSNFVFARVGRGETCC